MSAIPTYTPAARELAGLADEELERLAIAWRAQAARGDRNAFGLAHALEVECRWRQRESQLAVPTYAPARPRRPWWNWWKWW